MSNKLNRGTNCFSFSRKNSKNAESGYRQPDTRMSSGETDVEVDQILDLSSMNNIVSDHDDLDQNNIPVPIIAFGETKIKSPVQEVSTAGKSSL